MNSAKCEHVHGNNKNWKVLRYQKLPFVLRKQIIYRGMKLNSDYSHGNCTRKESCVLGFIYLLIIHYSAIFHKEELSIFYSK